MRTFILVALLIATSAVAAAGRTRDDVLRVIDRNKGGIYALYARELRNNPQFQGEVVLSISIAPNGTVTECVVMSSTLRHPAFEKQLVERFSSINFGAKGTFTYTLEHPITFISTANAKK